MSLDSKRPTRRVRNTKIIKSLEDVDQLMMLMRKNKIDYAEVDGVKFTKSQHEVEIVKEQDSPAENNSWINPFNS